MIDVCVKLYATILTRQKKMLDYKTEMIQNESRQVFNKASNFKQNSPFLKKLTAAPSGIFSKFLV
jgi:hypothetical protein